MRRSRERSFFRAAPPCSPPSRPSVTAAGFLHRAYGLLNHFVGNLVEVLRTLAAFASGKRANSAPSATNECRWPAIQTAALTDLGLASRELDLNVLESTCKKQICANYSAQRRKVVSIEGRSHRGRSPDRFACDDDLDPRIRDPFSRGRSLAPSGRHYRRIRLTPRLHREPNRSRPKPRGPLLLRVPARRYL